MIRAAALSYAIVFALLIGLVCSGILFISGTQKRIETIHNTKERLLFDSYSAIQMARNSDKKENLFIHENGDTSKTMTRQWGGFQVVCTHTFNKTQFKNRAAILGEKTKDVLPCLYIPGKIGSIKLSGDTKLEGKVFVPNKKIERANIAGKSYKHDKLVFGEIFEAKSNLPELIASAKNIQIQSIAADLTKNEFLAMDSAYSFLNETVYYSELGPIHIENNISGNVIIHSFDSIFISASSELSGVLIVAPKIRIQKGFEGDLQLVGHEKVYLEEGVKLLYPSAIVLNELEKRDEDSERMITFESSVELYGGVLITSQKKDFRRPPVFKMEKEAVVGGLVYVSGVTEIYGNIIGSLYTESNRLNAGGGRYTNHFMDVLISQNRLPDDFLLPKWLKGENNKLKVISYL